MTRWSVPDDPAAATAPPADADHGRGGRLPRSVKIAVAGGFGVGKTTLVTQLSEIPPLTTEASMTVTALGVDDRRLVPDKTTTTVAMDFGRITIDPELVVYLFGTPGQDRFGFMWDDVTNGALGAVILVDVARLETSFGPISYFEERGIPFVAAVNRFPGRPWYSLQEVTEALNVDRRVPVVECDARVRPSAKNVLIALLEHRIALAREGRLGRQR
ncbi:MAG: ATP/GTP-binding protein [Acidimicrobiia bacterium]